MSLIVASSSQQQYGGVEGTRTQTIRGIEAPSSFQNHFTSPIKIPKNAEIAVESVKIRRDALVDIESQTLMYKYFGALQTTDSSGAGYQQSRLEMPIPVRPKAGVYNTEDWFSEVARSLSQSYGHPEVFGKYSCVSNTGSAGEITGTKISIDQRASGALKDIVGGKGAVTGDTMLEGYWTSPLNLSGGYTYDVDWVSANQNANKADDGKKITRLAAAIVPAPADGMDDACSIIGNGCPFALVAGRFNTFVKNAAAGWRVGLSRPQMEYVHDTTTTTPEEGRSNLLPGTRHPTVAGEAPQSTFYQTFNPVTGRRQKDFYDYMVENDGTNISVYQLSYVSDPALFGESQLLMSEVKYWGGATSATATKYTTATFGATWDGVEFRSEGDEISLWFTSTGAGTTTQIVGNYDGSPGSASEARGNLRYQSFLPISECKNALYPRIMIKAQTESLVITKYTSHWNHNTARVAVAPAVSQTEPVFRYPTYDAAAAATQGPTFTTGDDFYSNNRVSRYQSGGNGDQNQATIRDTLGRPYALGQTLVCDTKLLQIVDQTFTSTDINEYDLSLAGSVGVNKDHGFIIGQVNPGQQNYYLEGKYATEDFSGQAKMGRTIGYPNRSFIDQVQGVAQGYATATAPGQLVIFNSTSTPDYRVHSAFVRISNMPIQSYNGAKSSVSKILYHLPRFTNDGREYGDLFFSPGEKTYVKLHNTSNEILNNIEVQIVDANERPVQDISGNTIVVFHLK